MKNLIQRDSYLNRLIDKRENGLVKVVTGIRRCGKSTLLFHLYRDYLLADGVREEQIISVALDDDRFIHYRDPEKLCSIGSLCGGSGENGNGAQAVPPHERFL